MAWADRSISWRRGSTFSISAWVRRWRRCTRSLKDGGWLPKGTHEWDRFVTPAELTSAIEEAGFAVADLKGVVYNPLRDSWSLSGDTAVNYMLVASRG